MDLAPVSDPVVGVELALPRGWRVVTPHGHDHRSAWQVAGSVAGEGFAAVRLDGADAGSRLLGWLEVPMAVTGGLDPDLVVGATTAEVLAWEEQDAEGFRELLGADEAVLRVGLARAGPSLLRHYVLLARIGSVAWKTALTLRSDGELEVEDEAGDPERADDVRARACLEELRLRP